MQGKRTKRQRKHSRERGRVRERTIHENQCPWGQARQTEAEIEPLRMSEIFLKENTLDLREGCQGARSAMPPASLPANRSISASKAAGQNTRMAGVPFHRLKGCELIGPSKHTTRHAKQGTSVPVWRLGQKLAEAAAA